MNYRTYSAFFPLVFLAVGLAAQTRSVVDLAGPKVPARDKKCEIQFFDTTAPNSPYEVLGHIRVYVSRDKLVSGSKTPVDRTKPEFQKQACRIGADAVVLVQQTVSNSGEFQTLYVKGDAIHFKN